MLFSNRPKTLYYKNMNETINSRIVILQKRAVSAIAKIQYREITENVFKELKILMIDENIIDRVREWPILLGLFKVQKYVIV